MHKKINIAMAGGGTGGHVFPIQSLIEYLYLKEQDQEKIKKIYRFGERGSLEEKRAKVLEDTHSKIHFVPIVSGKYRRETWLKSRIKNIRDIFLFAFGCIQAFFYLLYYKIDVVFCKGGYVALPVVLMGALLRKKILVHESDVRPGLVNKISSRFAKKVFTGFDNVLPKSITVGQILSEHILVGPQADKRDSMVWPTIQGIDMKKTLVVVTGGSQGSKRLYTFLQEILEKNKKIQEEMIFCVILGQLNQELASNFEKYKNVYVFDFLSQNDMGMIYDYSDIALTRAGTTSLAEQKLYDMRILMVPIPWTHDQYENAKWYVQHHKDILIDQNKPEFKEHLEKELERQIGYKKSKKSEDKAKQIHEAKEIIWKYILE